MMNFIEYAYFWGTLIILPLWIIIFVLIKEVRKEMIKSSILFGIAAVLIEKFYAIKDYWNPNYIFKGIYLEDFIYGFLFGGIASVTFEAFMGYHIRKKEKTHYKIGVLCAIITCLTFVILVNVLKVNSIVAHIIPPLIVGIIVIVMNKKLLIPSILSGIIITTVTFLVFQFVLSINPSVVKDYWMLDNISNILIVNIPIEEYLFAFALGFGLPGFYELIKGYDLVKDERKKQIPVEVERRKS